MSAEQAAKATATAPASPRAPVRSAPPDPGAAPTRSPEALFERQPPPPLRAYRAFAGSLGPLLARAWLSRRARRGKEDPARLEERFGRTAAPPPTDRTVWIHAASVGEALSALPLIERLRAERPDLEIILTTVTKTSAELIVERLPAGARHQFAPVDTVAAVRAFLDHWRPAALWVLESELWPTMLTEARSRGVKTALVSARMSESSAAGWARAPRSAAWLLERFDRILAQTEEGADRLARLGAPQDRLSSPGALKDAAEDLPTSPSELKTARAAIADRPLWLAASTHPGEETAVFEAHRRLRERFPNWLTILAPRHPERCAALLDQARAAGLTPAVRSLDGWPGPGHDLLMVDRLGELGLWYRLAPLAFVGGSLDPSIGGHNLREAARLGPLVVHGPHTANFEHDRIRLAAGDGAYALGLDEGLADALGALLGDDGRPNAAARAIAARGRAAMTEGADALARIWSALGPTLPGAAAAGSETT
ncbi:MAG: 3-deoxy-D-manno-octulosonic acid transferase [Pseudomonadota bacterium]